MSSLNLLWHSSELFLFLFFSQSDKLLWLGVSGLLGHVLKQGTHRQAGQRKQQHIALHWEKQVERRVWREWWLKRPKCFLRNSVRQVMDTLCWHLKHQGFIGKIFCGTDRSYQNTMKIGCSEGWSEEVLYWLEHLEKLSHLRSPYEDGEMGNVPMVSWRVKSCVCPRALPCYWYEKGLLKQGFPIVTSSHCHCSTLPQWNSCLYFSHQQSPSF